MKNGTDTKFKLLKLDRTHRRIDDKIANRSAHVVTDQLSLQRMKKEKLMVKDRIAKLQSNLIPDIIA